MPEPAVVADDPKTVGVPLGTPQWNFRRLALGFLTTLTFLFLLAPGLFALFSYLTVVIKQQQLESWQEFIFDRVLPLLKTLPADAVTLLVAAFPIAVASVCYKQTEQSALNIFGIVCVMLAVVGTVLSGAGYLLIDPAATELRSNLAAQEKLAVLNSLCERSLYVDVLYALTLLGLRPK